MVRLWRQCIQLSALLTNPLSTRVLSYLHETCWTSGCLEPLHEFHPVSFWTSNSRSVLQVSRSLFSLVIAILCSSSVNYKRMQFANAIVGKIKFTQFRTLSASIQAYLIVLSAFFRSKILTFYYNTFAISFDSFCFSFSTWSAWKLNTKNQQRLPNSSAISPASPLSRLYYDALFPISYL